jgi:uroporphyrinogen-III synthase
MPDDAPSKAAPLAGKSIAFLESRRAMELARLIERQGGMPSITPTLREVPVEDGATLRPWLDRLAAAEFNVVIFLTGVGCRTLLDAAGRAGILDSVLAGLAASRLVARGPKPVQVLKDHQVRIDYLPPEPNTSDELLAELVGWNLPGKRIGVQCYGGTTPFLERLRAGLADAGAQVDEVMPYRWEGPIDDRPVRELIAACLAGRVDALAVMSSSQIHNLFAIAEDHDQAEALQQALNDPGVLVAAIGPVARDAIESHGIGVDLEPEHPKMGHLVMALAARLGPRTPPPPATMGNGDS